MDGEPATGLNVDASPHRGDLDPLVFEETDLDVLLVLPEVGPFKQPDGLPVPIKEWHHLVDSTLLKVILGHYWK